MTDSPRYRYWGERKPVMLARPAETVEMAAAGSGSRTAKVRLYGPIDSWGAPYGVAASEVAQALDAVGESTGVEMHVHSPGGDAFEGLAIMNLLRQHKGGVDIIVDGLAASAASIVAMGANSVTMAPGSQMMIHDASALAIGQADDMREAATMLDSISSNAADQYAAKTGKPSDEMRAAMKATSWFKAQEAVDAGLADAVLAPDTEQAQTAAKAAASLRFDLSIYPNAPEMSATETPAEPPETPPTHTKEAPTKSVPQSKGLRERLGVADDADENTILAALDEALSEQADDKPAETPSLDVKALTAALEADGKVVVSKARFDALEAQASEGAKARATQIERDRDGLIEAAMSAGKISRSDDTRKVWQREFARDFDAAKADLESLPARFPIGEPEGHQGDGDTNAEVINDNQAAQLSTLTGARKEAFLA